MEVEGIPFFSRILDFLLIPLMVFLSGFHFELPQETHKWHMQIADCSLVDESNGIKVLGDDKSKFSNKTPLNHIPIFGGWKNYVVLEASGYSDYWNAGWKLKYVGSDRPDKCEIHKLRINSPYIKLLKGIPDSEKVFFGLNEKGEYVKLKIVGSGRLGDGQFRNVRLF